MISNYVPIQCVSNSVLSTGKTSRHSIYFHQTFNKYNVYKLGYYRHKRMVLKINRLFGKNTVLLFEVKPNCLIDNVWVRKKP